MPFRVPGSLRTVQISAILSERECLVVSKPKKAGNLVPIWTQDSGIPIDVRVLPELPRQFVTYTHSTNGWTSNEIGVKWLKQIFLPETDQGSLPRLLLLDGHGSHCSVEFMKICWENNTWPFYLRPYTSYICQPLDLACFAFVKGKYRQQIADLARFDDATRCGFSAGT